MFGTVLTAKDERLLVVYQTNILKTNPCQWSGANCNFETNHSTADIVSSLTNRQHFGSCQFNMRKFKPVMQMVAGQTIEDSRDFHAKKEGNLCRAGSSKF